MIATSKLRMLHPSRLRSERLKDQGARRCGERLGLDLSTLDSRSAGHRPLPNAASINKPAALPTLEVPAGVGS